jgi:hypothetical protein
MTASWKLCRGAEKKRMFTDLEQPVNRSGKVVEAGFIVYAVGDLGHTR